MLKVLSRGRDPAAKTYEGHCLKCDTRVSFQRADAKFVDDQRDGNALVVPCPTCKRDIWTAA